MASRRSRSNNGHQPSETVPIPKVDGAALTEEQYPKGTPTNDDGSVATAGEVTVEEARGIGALDAESALNNKKHHEAIARKRAGGNMTWNEADPLVKYDQVLAAYGTNGLVLFIIGEPEREGGQETHFSPVAAIHFQDGQSLYDYILRVLHKVNPPRQYTVRCRQGKESDRAVCRIRMPDTTQMLSPAASMQAPWMGPQVPGGYPQAVQQQPPYGYAPHPGYGYAPQQMQQQPPYGYAPQYPQQPQALPAAPQQQQAQAPQQQPYAQEPRPVALGQAQGPAPAQPPAPQAPQQPQYQAHPLAGQPGYPFAAPVAQPQQQQQPIVQPPPQTSDPVANAWMGAMYQMMQGLTGKLDTRSEMEKLAAFVDDVRSGRVSLAAPVAPALPAVPTHHAPPPPPAPAPQPAAAAAPPFRIPEGYAMLMTPTGQQILVPAQQVGLSGIQPPAAHAPAPQAPPPPPPAPIDPLDQITKSVEMVGTLAQLMDRVRGVAPAVQAAAPAAEAPAATADALAKRPFDTMQMGDMTLAVKDGDIHWLGTLLGNAPKVFGFAERFSTEAAKTMRAHELSKAVQTGNVPPHYIPVPTAQQQPQVPVVPPQVFAPQQPQQPVFAPPPVAAPPPAPAPAPQQVRQQTAAPKAEEVSPVKSIFQ